MPEPRTLTVDADLRRRMVVDLWLHTVRTQWPVTMVSLGLAGVAALLLTHNPGVFLVVVALLVVGQLVSSWVRFARRLGKRLPDGQVVSVGHTPTGDLVIRDTSEVWLPRGSARTARRIGSVTYVQGRGVLTMVPTDLLSDADAAFLEGHGAAPSVETSTDVAPDLPLAVTITTRVQTDLLGAYRRSFYASGDFGIVVAVPLVVIAPLGFLAGPVKTVVAMVFFLIPMALELARLQRVQRAVNDSYPVGSTLRARVDGDALVLALVHGSLRLPWSRYEAHRLRQRTIELRTRKGRPLANLTLPIDLFTPEALQVLRTHVPKSF